MITPWQRRCSLCSQDTESVFYQYKRNSIIWARPSDRREITHRCTQQWNTGRNAKKTMKRKKKNQEECQDRKPDASKDSTRTRQITDIQDKQTESAFESFLHERFPNGSPTCLEFLSARSWPFMSKHLFIFSLSKFSSKFQHIIRNVLYGLQNLDLCFVFSDTFHKFFCRLFCPWNTPL